MRTDCITGRLYGEADFAENQLAKGDSGHSRGNLAVVGIGPGALEELTLRAYHTIQAAEVIVGYKTYLSFLAPLLQGKEVVGNGMTKEVERCRQALQLAAAGKKVVVVSSGDPGIYGMAGLILELAQAQNLSDEVDFAVVPGVTAANAGAAVLGAPLMHDFCTISLSDLLTPWELIEERIEAAAKADFVIVIYNPKSHKRTKQILRARELVLKYRSANVPVGVVKNALRAGQEFWISDVEHFIELPIDMFTIVIVGNSQTKVANGRMVTPRGYTW